MNQEEYLNKISINQKGEYDGDDYVVSLKDSNEYGKIFSILDKCEDLDIMENNQVVTEQGSSLSYQSLSEDIIVSLLADFEGDIYSLVVNNV